jgi:hypothetical protein
VLRLYPNGALLADHSPCGLDGAGVSLRQANVDPKRTFHFELQKGNRIQSMHRLYVVPDDFEAVIRIFSEAEGGRTTPPFNGIRWDFAYASDGVVNQIYMIWPDFFALSGDSLPTDAPLPIGVDLSARMTIVVDEMRDQLHRARIEPGVEFYCHEGSKRVAIGWVTRVTGLHEVRRGTA